MTLIDGDRLAELMIEHSVGVTVTLGVDDLRYADDQRHHEAVNGQRIEPAIDQR